jgi:hypothetical protein
MKGSAHASPAHTSLPSVMLALAEGVKYICLVLGGRMRCAWGVGVNVPPSLHRLGPHTDATGPP